MYVYHMHTCHDGGKQKKNYLLLCRSGTSVAAIHLKSIKENPLGLHFAVALSGMLHVALRSMLHVALSSMLHVALSNTLHVALSSTLHVTLSSMLYVW